MAGFDSREDDRLEGRSGGGGHDSAGMENMECMEVRERREGCGKE